jgi:1-phosphofructokinase
MIVTVTANPAVDRTYHLAALHVGELHRATTVWVEASGKGVNVGRVLRRLGVPARMIVTAGGPEGRLLAELLRVHGVESAGGMHSMDRAGDDLVVDLVPVAGSTRVNVTLMVSAGGAVPDAGMLVPAEPTKINEPGTALTPAEADRIVAAAVRALALDVRWLACCGSLPAGTDPSLVTRLVEVGRAAGVPVAVDASGAALAAAVEARADLIKPNRDELAELTGRPVESIADALAAGRETRARTGGTVLVSLGADGAMLLTPAGDWYAIGPRITPVNTTGAGDALLAGYLADDTEDPAARLASAVAIGVSACLAAATAELPDELVDPARVRAQPLAATSSDLVPTAATGLPE